MATITISGLPEISTILDYTNIPVETVGITQRITGANLKNYLAALPAITATSGNISGQVTAGSLVVNGTASISGALSSSGFTSPTASINNLTVSNIAVTGTSSFSGNVAAPSFIAANGVYAPVIAGTLATGAQPNITSVGTLSALSVTAPIVGSVTGSALTVTQPAQPAITSVGTLTSLTVSGAASVGNLSAASISVATLSPTTLNSTTVNATNYTMSGTFLPTSNGTLNLGGPSNNFATVYATNYTMSGTFLPTSNGTLNLGGPSNNFATVYANTFAGLSTTAQYADLAECYQADAEYGPGTVVMFGDVTEVTVASGLNTTRVAGVISTNPAHLMNGALASEYVAKVALQGRVPCKVVGKIKRGDLLIVSDIDGVATASTAPAFGAVIGKALGSYNSESVGVIEVVVGRL
jgi:hypothetical protein